ncbi:MAG TPA: ATP-dependent Clp protease proteolytic subunit [Rhodothermales bacterium]|nr:ATP-dependent Clp protease proteolytic subunit [Rhodothermales bacterium]
MEAPFPTRLFDHVDNRLYEARTVIISGEINQDLASRVIGQLTSMAAESDKPITVFINSQGGHVESGDSIHDVIKFVRPRVRIIATGWAASAGALIYVAVPREDRYSLPNTRFLLHQPLGGMNGQAADIDIEAQQILKMRERLNRIFAEATGQSLEKIKHDTNRNFWLSAEDAVAYGLVGHIVQHASEIPQD